MAIRIVRLGTKKTRGEGTRIGTVTRSGDENRDPLAGVEAAAMVNETGSDG